MKFITVYKMELSVPLKLIMKLVNPQADISV